MVGGMSAKVYVNASNNHAVVFPLFGKYFQLHSNTNVLDFATDFIVNKNPLNVISFAAYKSQDEDTAIINLDQVA